MDAWQKGRQERLNGRRLTFLPDSDVLLKKASDHAGQAYLLTINPFFLTDTAHGSEYVDPVGQVSRWKCEKSRAEYRWQTGSEMPPCGAVYLDYSPFGAWWPERGFLVVGIPKGTIKILRQMTDEN